MDTIENVNQSYQNQMNQQQTNRSPQNELDRDSFMRLFIEGLKNQDPTDPMEQGEMMQQITQMTMIDNVSQMSDAVDQMLNQEASSNPLADYFDLIGKQVRVETNGKQYEGNVLSVGMQGDDINFEMDNGDVFSVDNIVGVSNAVNENPEPSQDANDNDDKAGEENNKH